MVTVKQKIYTCHVCINFLPEVTALGGMSLIRCKLDIEKKTKIIYDIHRLASWAHLKFVNSLFDPTFLMLPSLFFLCIR